jgi:hypothetical protein
MNDAWSIIGWTAQQAFPLTPNVPAITLPPNFTVVAISAKFVDDEGQPLNGSAVRFTPSVQRVADGDTAVWLRGLVAHIERGLLTTALLATDVVGVTPTFSWHVEECFPGGQEYDILVPSATVSPVSLFALPRTTAS